MLAILKSDPSFFSSGAQATKAESESAEGVASDGIPFERLSTINRTRTRAEASTTASRRARSTTMASRGEAMRETSLVDIKATGHHHLRKRHGLPLPMVSAAYLNAIKTSGNAVASALSGALRLAD